MRSNRQNVELLKIVELLAGAGADFVIIGGVAIQIQGGDHQTVDIDFAITRKRENARIIAAALAPYHPSSERMGRRPPV